MKAIKKLILAIAVIFTTLFTTGCEEIMKNTYFVQPTDYSANATANLQLQIAIYAYLNDPSTGLPKTFLGDEDDAIAWFNTQCDYMSSTTFTQNINVLGDGSETVMMRLISTDEAASRRVTFKK